MQPHLSRGVRQTDSRAVAFGFVGSDQSVQTQLIVLLGRLLTVCVPANARLRTRARTQALGCQEQDAKIARSIHSIGVEEHCTFGLPKPGPVPKNTKART
jgi:hypothetical protein